MEKLSEILLKIRELSIWGCYICSSVIGVDYIYVNVVISF